MEKSTGDAPAGEALGPGSETTRGNHSGLSHQEPTASTPSSPLGEQEPVKSMSGGTAVDSGFLVSFAPGCSSVLG